MGSQYRKEANKFKSEVSWTFWKFIGLFLLIIVILSAIVFGLRSAGIIGSTIVERKVFENSFQYKTGMAQRGAILEANIAEIDAMILMNPDNIQELKNQRSVLNVQLKAIQINQ